LSPTEIATLKARGDEFLDSGDITSARLFYQRAADGGDGSSAWRLGATFDPTFLSRAGIRGSSDDLNQALSWYQRARELDAAALKPLLGSVKPKSLVEPAALPEIQYGAEPECIAGPAPNCNGVDGRQIPPKKP
jgi:TPR repeat protein